MKKKIFLITLMTALLACFFVISISAANFESSYTKEVTKFYAEDGETELTPDWLDLDDKVATAVIKKANGEYIRIPLYYIYQEKGTDFMGNIRDDSNQGSSGFRYAWISEQLGETINHANLVALEIPYGTTTINNQFVGKTTIYSALEELVVSSSVQYFHSKMFRNNPIIKRVFVKQTLNPDGTVQGITTLPDYFADAEKPENGDVSSIEEFVLELDYLTSIGSNAFRCSALKEITIKGPITRLAGSSFVSCSNLETININNTGDIIADGGKTFSYCTSLKSVTLNGISLSNYAFEINDGTGTQGGLTFKATNVATIGTMPFKNLTNLSNAEISGPITEIGDSLFGGCTYLENVKITNTLEASATCGNNMCDGLKNLQSVELHGISIGNCAFRNINGTDMTVKCTNVGYIGTEAFRYAGNITELYISGPFTSVGSSTYRECPKLTKLTVINTGDTVVSAGNGESNPVLVELRLEGKFNIASPAFQNNTALKSVYLGKGVNEVGVKAFFQCFALEKAYLADTITSIGDSAFDMNGANKQTSESFMLVDENGNMDNTMPTSLTFTGGHFLKGFTFANTQLIYPRCYTSAENSAYDLEGSVMPENFTIVYLGKMTVINYHLLYKHNQSRNVTIYLANNSASDLKGERINVNIAEDGTISHGTYAGTTDGTLEIKIDNNLQNNIKAKEYVKFYFCGSNEIVFVTRVNIPREEGGSLSWGNFVSMPVTYEQLTNAGVTIAKHPLLSAPEYSDATCTESGGVKTYCLGCGQIASIEKTDDALGHDYDIKNPHSIEYTSFTEDGTYIAECARCHEDIQEVVKDTYLFVCRGYSAPLNGSGSVTLGFALNREAINTYSQVTGKNLEYGVFAVAQVRLGDNNILNSDGTEASGVIKADVSKIGFDFFEIKITGFVTDDQKNAKIAMGAYVIASKEETKEISYIQESDALENEKYNFVSYNDIIAK